MGWLSAEVKQTNECVRLWCRLKTMPEDRTAHGHSQHRAHGIILFENRLIC